MALDRGNTRFQATTEPFLGIFTRRKRRKFFLDLNVRPRSYFMQRAVTNFVLPIVALTAIATALLFPKPTDLRTAVVEAVAPLSGTTIIETGEADARALIQNYADVIPGLQQAVDADADCFIALDQASAAKLRRCAPAVTEIVAQITAYQDRPEVQRILEDGKNQKFVQQLQVAATEICRSIWATGDSLDYALDTPVCQVAQVRLAPSENLQ
jgi:hypothetical protein